MWYPHAELRIALRKRDFCSHDVEEQQSCTLKRAGWRGQELP